MSIGDSQNIFSRLKKYTVNWFGDVPLLLDSLYDGFAASYNYLYELIGYVRQQLRIKTATDDNLDLIAEDFFGDWLKRFSKEPDNAFRNRILLNLLREKATREAMRNVLFLLTGIEPTIIEPWRGQDNGYYDVPSTLAYDTVGHYGCMTCPYEAFIIVYRKLINGAANFGAYDQVFWGYDVVPPPDMLVKNGYVDSSLYDSYITNRDIYFAVESTRPNSTKIWVMIIDLEVG